MGYIELNELEKKIISTCDTFLWTQRIINHAQTILDLSNNDEEKIKAFFKECEDKIKSGNKECRIVYNNETFNFNGNEFAYIFFLYSEVLEVPLKFSVNIDTFEQAIILGNLMMPTKKEGKKLEQHLNSSTGLNTKEGGKVI